MSFKRGQSMESINLNDSSKAKIVRTENDDYQKSVNGSLRSKTLRSKAPRSYFIKEDDEDDDDSDEEEEEDDEEEDDDEGDELDGDNQVDSDEDDDEKELGEDADKADKTKMEAKIGNDDCESSAKVKIETPLIMLPVTPATTPPVTPSVTPQSQIAVIVRREEPEALSLVRDFSDLETPSSQSAKPNANYVLISSLKVGDRNWSIKARCVSKSNLYPYTNAITKREEFMFSLMLQDNSGDIKLVGFMSSMDLYDQIKFNMVYVVNNGQIRASRQPSKNSVEIHPIPFTTSVNLVVEQTFDVMPIIFEFLNLLTICKRNKKKELSFPFSFDSIGVVFEIGEPETKLNKTTNKSFTAQSVTVIDQTRYAIDVDFYNNTVDAIKLKENDIIVIKNLQIKSISGFLKGSLGTNSMPIVDSEYLCLEEYGAMVIWQAQLKEINDIFEQDKSIKKAINVRNLSRDNNF